jgi:hypothetical protein
MSHYTEQLRLWWHQSLVILGMGLNIQRGIIPIREQRTQRTLHKVTMTANEHHNTDTWLMKSEGASLVC